MGDEEIGVAEALQMLKWIKKADEGTINVETEEEERLFSAYIIWADETEKIHVVILNEGSELINVLK